MQREGGREGYGSHCNTKAGFPDASFRLDPFWKLGAGISFLAGEKKKKVVSHLLSEKLREGKGGGKRGRGGEKHCHNYMEFYLYIHMFISTYTILNLSDNVW